ncbi:cell envelope biogenesis protein TolA [Breoghania sp. L-A4]|uniref:cell envelope biogenesis protein TolA n=1 Tax=Breoghania sp. L-A4 TaxID=2304600 RepID=UPI000E35DD1B|nr:cell envelope biogenesis protein TolA [Breoghania sp. L-A4]AXS41792.1 cell envelope biogenesis protein TolA [Breoghania sp. L-A4]
MRAGFVASAVGHLAILAWGLVALPAAERFEVANVESLPVDLVPIEDITRLRIGARDAEQREEARPEPAKKPSETPTEAEKPGDTPAREATNAPPPAPEPAPEPVAEPAPTPEPEPVSEPAPAPEPQAEPEPAKEPVVEAAKPEPVPEPVKVTPRTKPTPPKPVQVAKAMPQTPRTPDTPEKPEKKFDPNNIAALLNKVEPRGGAAEPSPEPASLGSQLSKDTGRLTASEMELLITKIRQRFYYWGDDYPDDLNITIQFSLSQDGRLVGRPQVINSHSYPKFDALARAAVTAVSRVDQEETFAFLPRDKFGGVNGWSTVVVNFYPKQAY